MKFSILLTSHGKEMFKKKNSIGIVSAYAADFSEFNYNSECDCLCNICDKLCVDDETKHFRMLCILAAPIAINHYYFNSNIIYDYTVDKVQLKAMIDLICEFLENSEYAKRAN